MYGFDHSRTADQFKTAWSELRSALPSDPERLFLMGVSEGKLVLDGVPVESTPVERSFADLLAIAGIASIGFSARITQDEFAAFVRAFAAAGAKPTSLASQLKTALKGATGIRVNELRFVAEDSSATAGVAAQIAARTMEKEANQIQQLFNDPRKLLEMILAAEGREGGGIASGSGTGSGGRGSSAGTGFGGGGGSGSGASAMPAAGGGNPSAGAGTGPASGLASAPSGGTAASGSGGSQAWSGVGGGSATGAGTGASSTPGISPVGTGSSNRAQGTFVSEDEIVSVVRLLAGIHTASLPGGGDVAAVKKDFENLPQDAKEILRNALASLPAAVEKSKTDPEMLVKLAEHLSIQYALKRFERGDVKVNAVRQMLDRMSKEIESLRKVLMAHEEKMSKAGMAFESHADILDRQFWAAVPEAGKRAVLMSPEAYCVPPRNVKHYVTELLDRGSVGVAAEILLNYGQCVSHEDPEARRKAAIGMGELAELYARAAGDLLNKALQLVGTQVWREHVPDIESLLSAAFVRLSQEAASRRNFEGMCFALDTVTKVERERPAAAQSLRPRIGVENRLPDFIEESLRAETVPKGLLEVLQRIPRTAIEQLTARFNRAERKSECARLHELAAALGGEALEHLRHILRERPPAEAALTAGLLSLLDPGEIEETLPLRMREWERTLQDTVVREIAAAGSRGRGRLLARLLERLDPLVWSQAIDEIGMSGDVNAGRSLLGLASGERPEQAESYVRLKAIEALGRLRAGFAASMLRGIVEARQLWRWTHPAELRLVAFQALEKIDPEWAASYLPVSGLSPTEVALAPLEPRPDVTWLRQRRYLRIPLPRVMHAAAETTHGEYRISTHLLSLGGGIATCESRLAAGMQALLKLQTGLRPVRARVLIRRAGPQLAGFEFVDMELEERSKLRKLLAGIRPVAHTLPLEARPNLNLFAA
jgi:hypothetical protein